jgi:hypothetical protein
MKNAPLGLVLISKGLIKKRRKRIKNQEIELMGERILEQVSKKKFNSFNQPISCIK